jgi:hypothetical protein
MKVAWIQLGGAACAAVLTVLVSAPVRAADSTPGVTAVAAEELDKRSKQAQEEQGDGKGMSDSAVRVLMTYAFSIIPEKSTAPDGKVVTTDKSDPNKFLIPNDAARRVIRAATRTAYAEVCQIPELGRANFETMMKGEEARKTWSPEQLQMISALHVFSVSYFTGNIKITAKEEPSDPSGKDAGASAVAKGGAGDGAPAEDTESTTRIISAEAPNCPPDQKQKVTNAINAYVQAAQAKP